MLLLLTLVAMLLHVLPQYSHRDDQYNGERDEKW
jgi:hypothetical protein